MHLVQQVLVQWHSPQHTKHEGTNAVIKRDYTHREREPFDQFKVSLLRIVNEMATKHAEEKPFNYGVDISIECWRECMRYMNAKKLSIEWPTDVDHKTSYLIQSIKSDLNKKDFTQAVNKFTKKSWKDFDWLVYSSHSNSLLESILFGHSNFRSFAFLFRLTVTKQILQMCTKWF